MKYIGSGLWALAAAYFAVNGEGTDAVAFALIAVLIAVLGSNKRPITIINANKG